ncbi:MAG: lipopolysaccharide transport periplasmic protein LptA [Gammaproteobacteria bacterium]
MMKQKIRNLNSAVRMCLHDVTVLHPVHLRKKQKSFAQSITLLITPLLLLLFIVPKISFAEIASDQTAKLYITSDSAELNKSTGISTFTGNVKVDHGTTHVTCDKLTTYSDNQNHVVKAVAEGENGNLATYQTMTDPQKPVLNAKAEVIQYFPQRHYVILIGQAYVIQGKDSVAGPQLEYDVKNQVLITKTVPGAATGRTQIVIQPNELK